MKQDEDELEKLAWEIYTEALESIEVPDYVTINKNDDGTFSCFLKLSYKHIGSTYTYFKPSTVILKDLLQFSKGKDHIPPGFGEQLDHSFAEVLVCPKTVVFGHYLLFQFA